MTTRGSCRWQRSTEHAFATRSRRKVEGEVTCCGCKSKVDYDTTWVTVPYSKGIRVKGPVFVHCKTCMLSLDATIAYAKAYENDQKAAEPDPIRVAEEQALNDKYGIEVGEQRGIPIG